MNSKFINLMADLMEEETLTMAKDLIRQGVNPADILSDARLAMELVGKRFEDFEYFIPDLILAGEIMKNISDIVRPLLELKNTREKKVETETPENTNIRKGFKIMTGGSQVDEEIREHYEADADRKDMAVAVTSSDNGWMDNDERLSDLGAMTEGAR